MRTLSLLLAVAAATPARAVGQAPDLADLWRVAGGTLAGPAALETGPAGVFWNPAALLDGSRISAAVEVLQTPDVVSLSGVIGGLSARLTPQLGAGVVAGRMAVDELTRTTTSPTSELGEIPVFAQFLGVAVGARIGPAHVGVLVRGHDTRFDAFDDGGMTIDVGVRVMPLPRLTLAGATHFATVDLKAHHATDHYLAAEYEVRTATVWGSNALVLGRYGLSYRPESGGVEHGFSGGLALEDRLQVDVGWTREEGFGTASWRSVLGIAFRAGRYRVAVARGSGLNNLGATFRIGLRADVLP